MQECNGQIQKNVKQYESTILNIAYVRFFIEIRTHSKTPFKWNNRVFLKVEK